MDLKRNQLLQVLVVVLVIWLVVRLHVVAVIMFIAFLFTVLMHPVVNWLRVRHVPLGIAILIPVLTVSAAFALVGFFVVPSVVQFAHQVPGYVDRLQRELSLAHVHIGFSAFRSAVQAHISQIGGVVYGVTTKVIEVVAGLVTIFVVSIYWTATYGRTKATLLSFFPEGWRWRAEDIWRRIEKKLGTWLLAQLSLGVVVGLMVWLGAMALGLPFPGILGLLSGLLEVIPTLGPIVATIPGVLLALTISARRAVLAIILYVVVQQIENHVLAPWLLGRTVNLHPVIVILSLLIGTVLYGIVGALLAVPMALVISAGVDSYRDVPVAGESAHGQRGT